MKGEFCAAVCVHVGCLLKLNKLYLEKTERGQSRMINPKTLATLGTQDTERRHENTTRHIKLN